MSIVRTRSWRWLRFVLFLAVVPPALLLSLSAQPSNAETPEDAISRIRAGRHNQMPPPATAHAAGPAGKGMTIENGTGHTLHVHFSGPVSRTVVVPDGKPESVELVVGDYEVAAEVLGTRISPFYGRQSYQPFTHYWMKFYTQRVPR